MPNEYISHDKDVVASEDKLIKLYEEMTALTERIRIAKEEYEKARQKTKVIQKLMSEINDPKLWVDI